MADDLRERVRRILVEEVGPALQLDGGAIEVCGIDNGVVQLRLGGVCAGCPSSIMAVMMGLEQELCRRLPEVAYLEVLP